MVPAIYPGVRIISPIITGATIINSTTTNSTINNLVPLTIVDGTTNFPAATKGQEFVVITAGPVYLGGTYAAGGLCVNKGDILRCVADTVAGTAAQVYNPPGTYWNHDPAMINKPDGKRLIELSSNTVDPATVTWISNGFYVYNNVVYKFENYIPKILGSPVEIDAHTAQSLTAVQLSSVNMTTIHNCNQEATDVNNTLPTPAANLSALCTVATAQAGNYWRFSCTGKIYLNGSSAAKNYVQFSAPAVGDYFSFFTAKIADGSYVYRVTSGIGSLTTN